MNSTNYKFQDGNDTINYAIKYYPSIILLSIIQIQPKTKILRAYISPSLSTPSKNIMYVVYH